MKTKHIELRIKMLLSFILYWLLQSVPPVLFCSRCAFKIFQHHPQGMIGEFDRGICQTEDTPTEGTKVRCNAHRVGRLNRGDKLSIHVGSVVHDVISLEKDIHEFGLFEM